MSRSFVSLTAALVLGMVAPLVAPLAAPLAAQAPAAAAASTAPVVAAGDAAVAGRYARPGSTTRRLVAVQNGEEREFGTVRTDVTTTDVRGEPALRFAKTITTPRGTIYDTTVALRRSLVPVYHHSVQPTRRMRLDFGAAEVTGAVTPNDSAAIPVAHRTTSRVFDSAIADEVIAALPLADGYAARLPVYIYEQGGLVWYDLRVRGTERVAGASAAPTATPTEAWVVDVTTDGRQTTYWYAKATRELLRESILLGGGREMRIVP